MINPQKLRALREEKGWTLDMLGGKCKPPIDRGTINRIETGKLKRPPKHGTVLRLAAALGVKPEELNEAPIAGETKRARDDSRYETPLLNSTRNALTLVAHRYGMKPRVILELAPALFLLAAERHLAERRRRFDEMDQAVEKARAYSPKYLNAISHHVDEAMQTEADAISERDLFLDWRKDPHDVFKWNYEFETHAPFPNWLNEEFKTLSYDGSVEWWSRDEPPSFQLSIQDALWLANGDTELASSIASGHVPLHKLQGEERSDPDQRLQALKRLKSEHDETQIDIDALVQAILDKRSGNEEQIG